MYQRDITTAGDTKIVADIGDRSQSNFTAVGLLAEHTYVFSVVARNQYNITGTIDETAVSATTLALGLPSPPISIGVANVSGGSINVSFTATNDTGGVPRDAVAYRMMRRSLVGCYDISTGCSTCSHAANYSSSLPQHLEFYALTSLCEVSTGTDEASYCQDTASKPCGILVEVLVQCSSNGSVGSCVADGLEASTDYVVSLQTENKIGNSTYSDGKLVTTRCVRDNSCVSISRL